MCVCGLHAKGRITSKTEEKGLLHLLSALTNNAFSQPHSLPLSLLLSLSPSLPLSLTQSLHENALDFLTRCCIQSLLYQLTAALQS